MLVNLTEKLQFPKTQLWFIVSHFQRFYRIKG
jgi:hypothetical protein